MEPEINQLELPSWMAEKNEMILGPSRIKTHFLRNTLKHLSEVFENEFFCELYADKRLFLQSIDPRVKTVVFLIFILFSGFTLHPAGFFILAAVPAVYSTLSGIKLKGFLKKSWLYIPLPAFLIALPGATNFFIQGRPLFFLLPPGVLGLKAGVSISAAGLGAALRIGLHAGIPLSFGILLLLTTRWSHVTDAMAALHVPLILVSILNMSYRYIFVISTLAGDLTAARYLRTVGKLNPAESRKFVGHGIAQLFIKSHYLSEEIFDAMRCRCFTGRPVSLARFHIGPADWIFILNSAVILLVLLLV